VGLCGLLLTEMVFPRTITRLSNCIDVTDDITTNYRYVLYHARHRDAEGLISYYIYRCFFFLLPFFFFSFFSLRSLNGSQPDLDTMTLMTAI